MAAYWIGQGMTEQQIVDWAASSPHGYNLSLMREAIPEARRALYFADVIRSDTSGRSFAQLWYYNRGRTFQAGYGRTPTAAERGWAYQRPGDMLGLMFQVSGRSYRSGLPQRYTVTVNVPWTANMGDVEDWIRNQIANGSILTGDMGSEPIDISTLVVSLVGGALVERQSPTATMS